MRLNQNFFLQLHVYVGLFTAFYLLAFSLSSVVLNHGLDLEATAREPAWRTTVEVDPEAETPALVTQIQDELGIMGWMVTWPTSRRGDSLAFNVTHMGKTTHLEANVRTGEVEVSEQSKGLLAAFHGLHFFNGQLPHGNAFLSTWQGYQWLTMIGMSLSLISGLYLWIRYTRKKELLWLIGAVWTLSLTLMILL